MKKARIAFSILIVLASIVAVLLNNKARVAASARSDKMTSYPVSVAKVATEQLDHRLSVVGTISGHNDVALLAETQGRVVAVFADVGDHVKAGSVLFQVDDEMKKAALALAEVTYEKARKDLERYEALYKEKTISDAQVETVRQAFQAAESQFIIARRQYRDTRITSPISGVVTARHVDMGTMILDKMNVANVVDMTRLKVRVQVAEADVFSLRKGDRATVTTDVYPGVVFDGRISTIGAKADEGHTFPVEISLENSAKHPLKAGMFGRVELAGTGTGSYLTIPREAIIGSVRQPEVYVVQDGLALRRAIVVGAEFGTRLQVLGGLSEGDLVVANGHNNLQDRFPVTVIE